MGFSRRHSLIAGAVALGTLGIGGGYAYAAHHQVAVTVAPDGTIIGCVGGNGRLRIVSSVAACHRSEQVVTLASGGGSGGATGGGAPPELITFTDSTNTTSPAGPAPGGAFEIKDFSFGVESPSTIGSATGGAGAGKVKFNEFTIKRTIDSASPIFFKNCASGAHYKTVVLQVRKAGSTSPFLTYTFDTVFTTKVDWSGPGDEGPTETITFVYGKLAVKYTPQAGSPPGSAVEAGWDQISNKSWLP